MSTPQRAAIVAEARTWLGTPFLHQGRSKGAGGGVDCAGLVIGVARALGIADCEIRDYPAQPDPAAMRRALEAHLERLRYAELQAGDILWFRVDVDPQHLALVSATQPLAMIHAFGKHGILRVVESRVDDFWRRRLAGCYRYPGVA